MICKLLRSIGNGLVGLAHVIRAEQNQRHHVLIAIGVIAASAFFGLAAWEWIAVSLCVGLVIAAECMNTAVERLADRVSLDKHPLLKQAKDASAAAVLVMATTAAVVGCIVFLPRIWAWTGW